MDIQYLLFLQGLREAAGQTVSGVFEMITKLGEASVVTLLAAFIYWCVDKREGIFLMMTFYFNRVANAFVKITACVYRPWIRDPRVLPVPAAQADATGYSFPSGHSANATSFFGGLALNKKRGRLFRTGMVLLILLVGFSRNYLGVHTPQDVIVSVLLGAFLLFAFRALLEWIDRNPEKDWIVLAAGAAVCVLLIAYAALKSYPIDYDAAGEMIVDPKKMSADAFKNAGMGLGFAVGWFLERRYIKFETGGKWYFRAVRYLICIGIYEVLKNNVTPAVSGAIAGGIGKTAEQFVLILYITAGAPAIIKLLNTVSRRI